MLLLFCWKQDQTTLLYGFDLQVDEPLEHWSFQTGFEVLTHAGFSFVLMNCRVGKPQVHIYQTYVLGEWWIYEALEMDLDLLVLAVMQCPSKLRAYSIILVSPTGLFPYCFKWFGYVESSLAIYKFIGVIGTHLFFIVVRFNTKENPWIS